jgi:glutamine synthetase
MSKNEDPKFIQLRYTDPPDRFLAKYVAKNKEYDIENLYKYGIGFDGSSVRVWYSTFTSLIASTFGLKKKNMSPYSICILVIFC